MSVVSKLPTLVIQKIVDVAAESQLDSLVAWGDAPPLLAVCSAWRHAAKAMVYSKAFIESAEMGVAGLDSINQSCLLDRTLVSNFDIIAATNSTEFAKNIDVDVKTFDCLQVLVCGKDLDHYLLMDICVSVQSKLQICTDFGRLMLEAYLSQLKSLSCPVEILDGIVELPSQLTNLTISFTNSNLVDLPKLDVHVLETLEITNMPPNFDVISLATSGKNNGIEFSSL
ncbi:hypothetical protein LPJ57_000785, partial [Coemansia sp. RSA 486]